MTVELWSRNEFDYTYEREALDHLMSDMEFRFGNTDELYIVLANYDIENRQIDLTVLKRNAIIIIELKECNEPFQTSENGDWLTPRGHLVGKQGENPYQQVKQCRIKWFNLLEKNKPKFRCLATAQDNKPFWHTTGIVAISPSLHPRTENNISNESWWFKLCGLDELGKEIENRTNKYMSFSDEELRNLASVLLSLKAKSHITRRNIAEWEKQLKKREMQIEQREDEIRKQTKKLQEDKELLGHQETALKNWGDLLKQEKEKLNNRDEEISQRERNLQQEKESQ